MYTYVSLRGSPAGSKTMLKYTVKWYGVCEMFCVGMVDFVFLDQHVVERLL